MSAALSRYEIDDAQNVDISSYFLCQPAEVYEVSIDSLLGCPNKKITQTPSWTLCI